MSAARRDALAKGRGDGARMALPAGTDAVDDILACVTADPRWDRQIESREEYYAFLLLRLRVDPTPLREALDAVWRRHRNADDGAPGRDIECDAWLPVGVLFELAARGDARAAALYAAEAERGWTFMLPDGEIPEGGASGPIGWIAPKLDLSHRVRLRELAADPRHEADVRAEPPGDGREP